MPRRLALGALLAALTPAGAARAWWPFAPRLPDPADPRTTLGQVEAAISRLIPVPEITPEELAARMAAPGPRPLLLFDVREPAEHALSRIPGAILLDPALDAAGFAARHGAAVRGADVVFACAVGWRSGVMLRRVRDAVAPSGPASMANLRGGIFRWHAEGRPIEGGATVHHFDEAWGALLRRTLGRG
jgi:rhodanese-related sulfurtransferase